MIEKSTSNVFPQNYSCLTLVLQCVNRLSIDTRKIVRGHHTRRTSAFVRACAAFCFITIPSLSLVNTRLELYLLSGQVALLNQCYGQGNHFKIQYVNSFLCQYDDYFTLACLMFGSRCLLQSSIEFSTRYAQDFRHRWKKQKL